MNNSNLHISLIKRSLEGDRTAQKALFEQYNGYLFSIAYRYLNDQYLAEEVLQESWIQIFKTLNQYEEQGKFTAWIKTIVIKTAWKALRKQHVNINLETIQHPSTESLDLQVFDRLTCEEILGLLDLIPVGAKQVFKMKIIEGYSHVEIGKILGISDATSRAQLTKARRLLKEKFNSLNKISHDGLRAI